MGSWFFDQTGYRRQEGKSACMLRDAMAHARPRLPITVHERQLLRGLSALDLSAVNKKARIKWAEALCDQFASHFELESHHPNPDEPMYFITLVDVEDCSTSHDAKVHDAKKFIQKFRKGLQGLSYLAMVEPALFINKAMGSYLDKELLVSWHSHAVCWDQRRDQINQRLEQLNASGNYRVVGPGPAGAHGALIPKTQKDGKLPLADKFRYLAKSPRKAYRLGRSEYQTKDGELLPYFKINQQNLRHGECITLFRLMKHLYLDQLSFAGGQGVEILAAAKKQALNSLHD
jgi:hypothetical protein